MMRHTSQTAGDMEFNPPKISDSSLLAMILAIEQSPYTKFNINNKNRVDINNRHHEIREENTY